MSYVIQAVLSNPRRPECDQITIPFPIPFDQYDKTIEMLQAIDLRFSMNRDCTVDEVNSRYSVLNTLVGTLVNIDQLDYLAKRLDGFCAGEVSQFQAMAHKLGLSEIKDFIKEALIKAGKGEVSSQKRRKCQGKERIEGRNPWNSYTSQLKGRKSPMRVGVNRPLWQAYTDLRWRRARVIG